MSSWKGEEVQKDKRIGRKAEKSEFFDGDLQPISAFNCISTSCLYVPFWRFGDTIYADLCK